MLIILLTVLFLIGIVGFWLLANVTNEDGYHIGTGICMFLGFLFIIMMIAIPCDSRNILKQVQAAQEGYRYPNIYQGVDIAQSNDYWNKQILDLKRGRDSIWCGIFNPKEAEELQYFK